MQGELRKLWKEYNSDKIEDVLRRSTIIDKIIFSSISKESILAKLKDLRERQVPERDVLPHMKDEAVVDYWFRNWLHPSLKHAAPSSPESKVGCSKKVLEQDARKDSLRFYENGQQNFDYTLSEIEEWAKSKEEK